MAARDDAPVGTVAEEAAKLLQALQGWAGDASRERQSVTDLSVQLRDALREVDGHVSTGGEDCRYCPLCRLIAAMRATSPEVGQHVAAAATSLLQAGAAFLEGRAPAPARGDRGDPVEHIDLDDDLDWED